MDCSPPGSSIHGIPQARILEWVAIPFSRGCSWPWDRTRSSALEADYLPPEPPGKPSCCSGVELLSHVRLFAVPWTVAYQAPQSLEFSRQEYWSGLPFPSPCCSRPVLKKVFYPPQSLCLFTLKVWYVVLTLEYPLFLWRIEIDIYLVFNNNTISNIFS